MCVSGCPYKKIYYNWQTGKAEKCIFCYPASRRASPPCAKAKPVWARIRYLGGCCTTPTALPKPPACPTRKTRTKPSSTSSSTRTTLKVIAQARKDGIPEARLEGARNSPVYKMAIDWKVACPCTPSTARCRWCGTCPAVAHHICRQCHGHVGVNGELPDLERHAHSRAVPGQPADRR